MLKASVLFYSFTQGMPFILNCNAYDISDIACFARSCEWWISPYLGVSSKWNAHGNEWRYRSLASSTALSGLGEISFSRANSNWKAIRISLYFPVPLTVLQICTRVPNEKAATVLSLHSRCNAEAWDGSKAKLRSNIWDLEMLQASRKNGKPPCSTLNKGCCYRNGKCFLSPSGQVTVQDSAVWWLKSAPPKETGPGHHPGHVLFFLEEFIHHWFKSARALHKGFFFFMYKTGQTGIALKQWDEAEPRMSSMSGSSKSKAAKS